MFRYATFLDLIVILVVNIVLTAGAFVAFGMSGCVPVIHHIITDGYHEAVNFAALGTLIPMALLYLAGAVIYALRFPESIWPGKFDIWVR